MYPDAYTLRVAYIHFRALILTEPSTMMRLWLACTPALDGQRHGAGHPQYACEERQSRGAPGRAARGYVPFQWAEGHSRGSVHIRLRAQRHHYSNLRWYTDYHAVPLPYSPTLRLLERECSRLGHERLRLPTHDQPRQPSAQLPCEAAGYFLCGCGLGCHDVKHSIVGCPRARDSNKELWPSGDR
jgi:hypothetical protein